MLTTSTEYCSLKSPAKSVWVIFMKRKGRAGEADKLSYGQ
jgi:hypothetical protein